VTGTVLTPITNPHFGLVALFTDIAYARSTTQNNQLLSEIVSLTDSTVTPVTPVVIPEKCSWINALLLCASQFSVDSHTYIEDWYKGVERSNDVLWRIDPSTGGARMLINPELEIGRPLDIQRVSGSSPDELFFINRLDNSLWRYVESPQE
jgi:hypothetical protein